MAPTSQRPQSTGWLLANRSRWALAIALLCLAVYLVIALASSDLRRPFHWDELTTLRYYTWAGVEADGEPRNLSRLEDIRALERPSLRQGLIGLYCSIARWPEPGNHVVNSLLADISLAVFSPAEVAIRLPAVLGALVFGLALFWLWDRVLLWKRTSLLALILALSSPYLWHFSHTGRGYTWMLALQVLLLIVLLRFAGRPHSILFGSLAVLVSTLTFMNVLTTALYWLIPVYFAFFLITPDSHGRSNSLNEPDRSQFRRGLLIQLLCLGALGTVFIIDRLPYIYSTSTQAGLSFSSPSGMLELLAETLDFVFPTFGWKLLAAVGFVGLLFTPPNSARRTVAGVGLMAVGLAIADFLFAGRIPVPRVSGFLLPVVLLTASGLLERLLSSPRTRHSKQVAWSVAAAATVAIIATTPRSALEDSSLTEFMVGLSELPVRGDVSSWVVRQPHVPLSATLYYPEDWQPVEERSGAIGQSRILLVIRDDSRADGPIYVHGQHRTVETWQPHAWPSRELVSAGDRFRVLEIPGTASKLSDDVRPDRALVFWYPEFAAVAVSPNRVLDHLYGYAIRFLPLGRRYQAKLEVFGRLGVVVLPVDSQAEFDRVRLAVTDGLAKLGGQALVFIPASAAAGNTNGSDS